MNRRWNRILPGVLGIAGMFLLTVGVAVPTAMGQAADPDGVKRVPVPDDKPDPTKRGRTDAEKIQTIRRCGRS